MSKESLFGAAFKHFRSPLKGSFRGKKSKKPSPRDIKNSKAPEPTASEDEDVNMGKSNKFDYTNRPNSGAKLGQIISAALQKEAEKAKKDDEKHIQKARKQSTDSVGGCSDNLATKHILDLKAPGKDLGDEGVIAMVDGLEIAIKSGNSTASLALEDLNLSNNGITTVSLARLAPIIEHAKCDLKTLNLTGNKISVETDEQAQQWEAFLKSFRGCLKLRRLDLSGNPQLTSRALEIFARVHTAEPPISPISAGGEASVLSLLSEVDEDLTLSDESIAELEEAGDKSRSKRMTAGQLMKRRCGLRSIPYITVHDVGLDDAAALWLSYIMTDHHYPNQILDDLNATNPDSVIKTYQQDTNSRGVDWTENASLSKEAKHLLEKAEILRRQTMFDDIATVGSGGQVDDTGLFQREDQEFGRRSTDRRHSRAAAGDRRFSIRSIRTEDGGEHEATELESMQRKFQRQILEHDGPQGVELWKAGLKVFKASRMILYITSATRKYYDGEPTFRLRSFETPDAPTIQPPSPTDSRFSRSPRRLSIDTPKQGSPFGRPSYVAKLTGQIPHSVDVPESPLTEVTNTPVTPLLLQKRMHRQGAFSEGTDLYTVTDKFHGLLIKDDNPDRFVLYQQRRVAGAEHSFRDRATPCHLPTHLLQRIIRFTMRDREMNVLNARQMQIAIEKGQNRDTLKAEREWLKRDESAQLWMLLDSISCLAYGME
jgi:hypothetical protein